MINKQTNIYSTKFISLFSRIVISLGVHTKIVQHPSVSYNVKQTCAYIVPFKVDFRLYVVKIICDYLNLSRIDKWIDLLDSIISLANGDPAYNFLRSSPVLAQVLRNQIAAEAESNQNKLRIRIFLHEILDHIIEVIRVTCKWVLWYYID